MTIKFTNPAEQNELIAAMVNKNATVSIPAQEAFAEFISPVLDEALLVMGTSSLIYETIPFAEDESPEMPVDPYFDAPEGYVSVWSQETAGGLPTNLSPSYKTVKLSTYELDSAISYEKRVLAKSKINLLERGLERMANEVLIKQERNAWAVIMAALAPATFQGTNNVIRSTTDGVLQMDDFNNLYMLADRINAAFNGGTPAKSMSGLTDLFLSPEGIGAVRSFVYQPMNTRSGNVAGTDYATSIALPDSVREQIFKAGGNPSLFDVELHKLWELGTGNRKYNLLFSQFAGSKNYDVYGGSGGSAFSASADQISVGINKNWRQAYRPVELNSNGGQLTVLPDNQYVDRQKKVAFYASLRESRVIGTNRMLTGLIW